MNLPRQRRRASSRHSQCVCSADIFIKLQINYFNEQKLLSDFLYYQSPIFYLQNDRVSLLFALLGAEREAKGRRAFAASRLSVRLGVSIKNPPNNERDQTNSERPVLNSAHLPEEDAVEQGRTRQIHEVDIWSFLFGKANKNIWQSAQYPSGGKDRNGKAAKRKIYS